ncbi:type IV secretion system protein [Sphingomonas kaistensis]|uniref:Type IV secretion system protein n=1 Tax=Sphingomonas kaistensis TaxID=298708 RepID=A0ABZ2G4J7_9SPHN
MSSCPPLSPSTASGIADVLRSVDCVSAEAAAGAFGRLFGPDGRLGTALTLLLTLYIALLAVNLLTGRARIGLSMLTPRMMTLGLVLTFATSWIAYQSVVWTLLTGAPDQIAAVVTNQQGSATAAFANRLDTLFTAVANAAEVASTPAPVSQVNGITPAPAQAAGWTAGDVLWMAALMLLLGTVGVLLVARIALAALLAIGPVFIVFALFRGTHGLFVGWLKGAVLFAIVPLFTVLIGGAALALLSPIVAELAMGPVSMRAAVSMFLGASVYVALMVLVLKVSSTIVAGWRIGRGGRESISDERVVNGGGTVAGAAGTSVAVQAAEQSVAPTAPPVSDRVRAIVSATQVPANDTGMPGAVADRRVPILATTGGTGADTFAPRALATDRRVQGVGTRFRSPAAPSKSPGKPVQ